jgi:hypothetical protein
MGQWGIVGQHKLGRRWRPARRVLDGRTGSRDELGYGSEPWQVSARLRALAATLGISLPRCPYNGFVYIKRACAREKNLLFFVAILHY